MFNPIDEKSLGAALELVIKCLMIDITEKTLLTPKEYCEINSADGR
jgi:hypothetical protein